MVFCQINAVATAKARAVLLFYRCCRPRGEGRVRGKKCVRTSEQNPRACLESQLALTPLCDDDDDNDHEDAYVRCHFYFRWIVARLRPRYFGFAEWLKIALKFCYLCLAKDECWFERKSKGGSRSVRRWNVKYIRIHYLNKFLVVHHLTARCS